MCFFLLETSPKKVECMNEGKLFLKVRAEKIFSLYMKSLQSAKKNTVTGSSCTGQGASVILWAP